jgi:N-acyl-D-aspartate/D-glutamate deacylase
VFDTIVRRSRAYPDAGNPWMEADTSIAGRKIVGVGSLSAAKGGAGELLGTPKQVGRIVRAEAP